MISNNGIFAKISNESSAIKNATQELPVNETLPPISDWFKLYGLQFDNNEKKACLFIEPAPYSLLNLTQLARKGSVVFSTASLNPVAELVPHGFGFCAQFEIPDLKTFYKVSRFAYISSGEGCSWIKSPRAFAGVRILNPLVLMIFHKLTKGCTALDLLEDFNTDTVQALAAFLFLCNIQVVLPCNNNNLTIEETDPTLRQWEFHDLLMHTQSRLGRSEDTIGGSFRFKGILEPQPALKPRNYPVLHTVYLPRPDLSSLLVNGKSLAAVIEERSSLRNQGEHPITLEQISLFLFQVCRLKHSYIYDSVEYTRRPYPNGGGSYELEFYLTVHQCRGLNSGFYHYDPAFHSLELIKHPCFETEQLLKDIAAATLGTAMPQLAITFASRFQRVAWKYKGIAYATQLKNVGVVYAYMYLVATSLGLAPCAIGSGNADLFCHLADTDYYKESSIGEFMLGSAININ